MNRNRETVISVSPELRRLMIHCETFCSADCCKSGAFDTSHRLISQWLDGEKIDRTESIRKELICLLEDINCIETKIRFEIRGMESEWDKADAFEFITDLNNVFNQVVNKNKS